MGERILAQEDIQILDFEELLGFIEQRLADAGMRVERNAIITILQAEEAFLLEKGVLQELSE
jgi:hypothetical protein